MSIPVGTKVTVNFEAVQCRIRDKDDWMDIYDEVVGKVFTVTGAKVAYKKLRYSLSGTYYRFLENELTVI